MDLYFSPLACSLATRIALYESRRREATYLEVDSPRPSWCKRDGFRISAR